MRVPTMPTYNQHVVTQERRNVMIIYMTLVISKGGDGARARARDPHQILRPD